MPLCWSCGEGSVIVDPASGAQVCESCGLEHGCDDFRAQGFAADGRPEGTLIHSVGDFGYRERKVYRAKALISDVTTRFGLSATRAAEVTAMVSSVTDGEFGDGDWFPVLIGACSYLVTRQNLIPLPITEVAHAIGCDDKELGRMISRVVQHLDLHSLPKFDAVLLLDRTVRTCHCFSGLEKATAEEMIGQGRFLVQCATKWFLTTGRHPLPVVAAVVAFVAEVNGVAVGVEEIAKEIYARVATSKKRLKELMATLVRAARALLPWGDDVTVKNLVLNAPLLIRLMEMKSRSEVTEDLGVGMDDLLDAYSIPEEEDAKYFNVGVNSDELKEFKISGESLFRAYKNLVDNLALVKEKGGLSKDHSKKRRRLGFDFEACKDSLQGIWDSDTSLTLKEVLHRDIGYDSLPPCFVTGAKARKSRRIKIEAAKRRINEIMKPPPVPGSDETECRRPSKPLAGKKRKRGGVTDDGIDWEDCLIELFLLHGVNEDEIEQGQYRRLLDLHVFN